MFQVVSDRALFSPYPSRLLLSVRVPILKEYENLHVHFEDCVGRRVTNASGAFLELAPSSGSSINRDAFHNNIWRDLYLIVMVSQLYPFPTPGMPHLARLNKIRTRHISNSWHHVLRPSFTTPSLTFCAYASLRTAAFQAAGEAPCIYLVRTQYLCSINTLLLQQPRDYVLLRAKLGADRVLLHSCSENRTRRSWLYSQEPAG